MPKAKKKSNRARPSATKGSRTTSNYFFYDVLALAGTLVNRKKEVGAEKISEFAEATREFATSMTALPNLGDYVDAAAESLDYFSEYMRETEFEQIVVDASTFAKKHPVVVVAGGALAGFITMLLLRSDGSMSLRHSAKPVRPSGSAKRTRGAAAGSSKGVNGQAHLH